jgi:hypothetical protein
MFETIQVDADDVGSGEEALQRVHQGHPMTWSSSTSPCPV